MKLTVIIVAIALLACAAAGVAVAKKASPDAVLKDLDSLTLQADNLSNTVESRLVDLNVAANNTSVTSAGGASAKAVASRGVSEADTAEKQLSEIEKSLWTIQSQYNPAQYANRDATAIESRMSYLQNRITHIGNMISDMRIAADRISRGA